MNDEIENPFDSETHAIEESLNAVSPDGQTASTAGIPNAGPVVIAATFTAEPLERPLKFWMAALDIDMQTVLAPYAQVMQQLLDPASAMSQNQRGFNVLLIRPEDWIREKGSDDRESKAGHLRGVAHELIAAMILLRERSAAALLVFVCPASADLPQPDREMLEHIEDDLAKRSSELPNTYCSTDRELMSLYPLDSREDRRSDRIGHIPYTQEYFAAIATLIARRIAMSLKPRCKVIAVDCDNTLWHGVCGETGPNGVDITAGHVALQSMLVCLHDAGVLLCLCSKNNAEDVSKVFAGRPEMPLREEHFIAARVNWESKPSNLRSLAAELDLALGSFAFIDDSPLECAQVQAQCPSVLALQFPQIAAEITHFVAHTWAFDLPDVTQEAKRRTHLYRENRARDRALTEATDLAEFLATLELNVDIAPLQSAQLPRVAELIQRTTQFNLTGIRRSAAELESLLRVDEVRISVVNVQDRFGDYGLVGAVIFRSDQATIDVDTLVLSCRALGRGVEHRIISELARIAQCEGATSLTLRYRQTDRNTPAWKFLETLFREWETAASGGQHGQHERVFEIPVERAAHSGTPPDRSDEALVTAESGSTPASKDDAQQVRLDTQWHETAYRLSRVPDLLEAINAATAHDQSGVGNYIAPRTPTESAVAEIWQELLAVQRVGIADDFFDLGGDSLLAVRAIARVGGILNREVSIGDFFAAPTVHDIALKLADAAIFSDAIRTGEANEQAPLSSAQRRLWFIDRLEGGSTAYHIPVALRIDGELDRAALQAALDSLIERHQALRTVFVEIEGEAIQRVRPPAAFALRAVDLQGLSPAEQQQTVQAYCNAELLAPFDLRDGPLIRGVLLQFAVERHLLLLVMHHMVSDGWSVNVLLNELGLLYDVRRKAGSQLPAPLPIQYTDYARWQRRRAAESHSGDRLAYWVRHLSGAPALLELPTDRPRPPVQSYRGATLSVAIDRVLTGAVKALSRRLELTLVMTLQAMWSILLARMSGQDDAVIGMPVANRPRAELEGIVGFFVNTLAVRTRTDDDPSVQQLLLRAKTTLLEAYSHQDVPFDQVVEALQPVRSLSHSPIFQVMFAWQGASSDLSGWTGLVPTIEPVQLNTAQFDLLLSLQESPEGVVGTLNYATDLFDEATIQRWIRSFISMLNAAVRDQAQPVDRLPLLLHEERHQLLEVFNATRAPYASEQLLHELIEEQVGRTPHAVAVEYEGQLLTYAELDGKANQLARYLREKNVGPDQLVGICIERSVEMVIGLLGILKAGGAYVPIDPNYPIERLEHMLTDASPRVLLTQQQLRERLPATSAAVIALDSEWEQIAAYSEEPLDDRPLGLSSSGLAYVIYTSGSTGAPKGAMNEHRAVINRLQWMQQQYRLGPGDRVLQKTPFSFDVSVWEFFWTLMTGARLVMARPQGHQDPDYLRELIERAEVTRLHFVPSMLQIFVNQLQEGQCPSLRHVVCSGEELPASLQRKFFERLPHARLSNLYGPTEAAVDVTYWECDAEDRSERVPIGRPISNTRIYVLDRHLQPVPLGVTGELYIGGDAVGRGYLNRAELTAERFIADPFSDDPQARLYKTGDLGRWRADGAIEYLGRNDHQVKIRGFRIELGEIEAQVLRHAHVKEAVVIAREDVAGEKRLVAYVVPQEISAAPSVEALRQHLKAVLPDHMVPSAFVQLQSMPLTPNGKLDRRTLPAPELDAYVSRQYEAPQGEIEEHLAGIWQSLLPVERVGRHDNFFELGGHSLLVMQAIARLESEWTLDVPIRSMFDSPTLAGHATYVEELRSQQLLERIATGGAELDELLETLASMPDSRARELLQTTATERGL